MHLPKAVADGSMKHDKNYVRLHNQNGDILGEYGITESDNEMKCFVAVSTGDKLTVEYQVPSGEKVITDLIVDGILHGRSIARKGTKTSRGSFAKALCCDWSGDQKKKKGKLQEFDMVVQERAKEKCGKPLLKTPNARLKTIIE
jgi:hypothetical protein